MLKDWLMSRTLPSYDCPGQSYYPVDEVCWTISEKKIRIVKNKVGKCSYMCWRQDSKGLTEYWAQIGPTNVTCRYLDNKLCFMLFPIRFAEIFEDLLS
jgi:hypothetical protein